MKKQKQDEPLIVPPRFQVRSLEILDSFGIADKIWNESNHMIEVCFWNPDETGSIRRDNRVVNGRAGLSRFHEVVLHQGRAETFFLDAIRDSYGPATDGDYDKDKDKDVGAKDDNTTRTDSSAHPRKRIAVERKVMPTSLALNEQQVNDTDAYPITVTLRHLSESEATPTQMLSNVQDGLFRSNLNPPSDEGPVSTQQDSPVAVQGEVVQCKYVVGCDGAHSWTRKALGPEFDMVGEMTDYIWGVLDIVPITNFRMSSHVLTCPRAHRTIHSFLPKED